MKQEILKTKDLIKKYKDNIVLDKVNITINKGDIYGLVGSNGAGKSTLMNVISSLTMKDSGKVYLFGKEIAQNRDSRNRIG